MEGSEAEEKIEELIARYTDIKETEANILVYLVNASDSVGARELENELNLRQPSVSVAINALRDKELIETEEETPEGKGRPRQFYTAKVVDAGEYISEELEKVKSELETIKGRVVYGWLDER